MLTHLCYVRLFKCTYKKGWCWMLTDLCYVRLFKCTYKKGWCHFWSCKCNPVYFTQMYGWLRLIEYASRNTLYVAEFPSPQLGITPCIASCKSTFISISERGVGDHFQNFSACKNHCGSYWHFVEMLSILSWTLLNVGNLDYAEKAFELNSPLCSIFVSGYF